MKNRTLKELNEQYKDCPQRSNEYVIGGKKYVVYSHFVGKKDIDKVLYDLAFRQALNDDLKAV